MTLAIISLALAAAPTQLTIDVKPAGTDVYVDGVKKGKARKPIVVKLKPGKHVVRLVYKGDAHEEEVTVKSGENRIWKWEFTGVEPAPAVEMPTDEEETGD